MGQCPNPQLSSLKIKEGRFEKRNIRKEIRLNEVENEKLIADVSKSNENISDYFRKLIMEEQVKEKPDYEFYEVMKQLSKIGVNLNQIAHKANATNVIDKDFYKNEAQKWHQIC